MVQNKKQEQEQQEQDSDLFMPYWKNEEQCYLDAKVEGFDRNKHKVTTTWPSDKPQAQIMYELWLKNARDPDSGKFYEQRDRNGNTIKGTGPKHLIRQIVRIKTNDNKEWLYSNGIVSGFDAAGEEVHETC